VTCPYADPDCRLDVPPETPRCLCGRYVKHCSQCAARNRAFAHFCRGCGAELPPSRANWAAYRGGPRRLGANSSLPTRDAITGPTALRLRLGDACRALLGYDGHLIAVSVNGVVEIADPLRAKSLCRFQVQGPITAEPCIHDGILYLATRGQLTAYALAGMTLETPRVRPLWHVPLNATPIQALTAVANRLYVTMASADWREVHVIEKQAVRLLYGAQKMSWIVADAETSRAMFLSEDGGNVQLHVAGDELATYSVPLHGLAEHPIALLGGTVFAVFGEAHRLYRIDAVTGAVDEPLEDDTQFFALTCAGDDQWDRDSVRIDSSGVLFSRTGVRDSFAPHERATKGSPVIVQGNAVAVGMDDGRVLIYSISQLPRHDVWRLGDNSGAAITALASFDSCIAAGNRDGVVEVRELLSKGAGQ
jgi:hypothetical protein